MTAPAAVGPDRRVNDWLESGVAALSGFVPPGCAATQARMWSQEFERLTAFLGYPVRVDGARLLAERAALTGGYGRGNVSVGGACRLLPAADGWIAASLPRPSDLELIAPLTETESSDPWQSLTDWVAESPADRVVARARLLGIALSRVGEGAAPLQRPAEPAQVGLRRRWRPLVVDFSSLWAGPLCGSLLTLAGARVVKVESVSRLDGARRGEPNFYDLLHTGQESVCVDPGAPQDRAALKALVAAADVVIASSRPRALAGWGLDAAAAARTGTVWVSITAYGRDAADRVGFGDDVAAGAGLVGWIDGAPRFVGDAIADPLTGLSSAVATLRSLSTGSGAVLDMAMASVVALTLDGTCAQSGAGLPVSPPRSRSLVGRAPDAGVDTARVFAEFR